MLAAAILTLSIGRAVAADTGRVFDNGQTITYKKFWKDYKKGSILIPGKRYTMYACIDGTVQLPFYKGILSPDYYFGSACYGPEQVYITHDNALSLQQDFEFRHMKGMAWVTVSVNVDGGIAIVDFKR